MSDPFQSFLTDSPLAGNIKLPTRIVLDRLKLSLDDLEKIKNEGKLSAEGVDLKNCSLEIGGAVIALGEIVETEGKAYFKITKTSEDFHENSEN